MRWRRSLYAALVAIAGGIGCNALLGLESAEEYHPSAAEFPNPYPVANTDAAIDGPVLECNADVKTDPRNCGRCGRDCGANLRCADGRCDPVQLAADLTSAPARLVVANGRGFYSTTPQVTYLSYAPYFLCYQTHVFSFPVRQPGPVLHVASPCSRSDAHWGTDGAHVYGWTSNLYASTGFIGALVRYGPDALPDGGENDAGTPTLTDAGLRDFIVPDPARPGEALVGPPTYVAAATQVVSALSQDGGLSPVLTVGGLPGVFGNEQLLNLDATPTSFTVVSRNTSTNEPRIWTAPRGCDASTCTNALAATYATICGVRRFGNAVRWCGLQADPSGTTFLLVLLEADADKGIVRVVNSAPVVPRGLNGTPVLPILLLEDAGIYYARGVRIDLLPLTGAPEPIALTTTKPLALASDETHLYWSEVDAIYGVVR
jgi:hypothetical protein